MVFKKEEVNAFLSDFETNKSQIRSFDGCQHLELWKEAGAENTFLTYSHWEHPDRLESYRRSELFKGIWSKTKPRFEQKAKAWSVDPWSVA